MNYILDTQVYLSMPEEIPTKRILKSFLENQLGMFALLLNLKAHTQPVADLHRIRKDEHHDRCSDNYIILRVTSSTFMWPSEHLKPLPIKPFPTKCPTPKFQFLLLGSYQTLIPSAQLSTIRKIF